MANVLAYDGRIVGEGLEGLPATNISYNNTSSGMSATNAQTAIDELSAGKLDNSGPVFLEGQFETRYIDVQGSGLVQIYADRIHYGTVAEPAVISCGNPRAADATGTTYGDLQLYGADGHTTELIAPDSSANREIRLPDASGTLMIDKGSVSVTADGVKDAATIFAEIFAQVDMNKVTDKTTLHLGSYSYSLLFKSSSQLEFSYTVVDTDIKIQTTYLGTTTAWKEAHVTTGGSVTIADQSSFVPSNGSVYSLQY